MPDLLLELFSEEIPARMQRKAAEDLRKLVTDALVEQGLLYEGAKAYATPRRLALHIVGLPAAQGDRTEEKKGPRVGAPEAAIQGFLRSAGLASIDQASIVSDPKKGDFYMAVAHIPGRPTPEVLADLLPTIIRSFPWPKSMRWGTRSKETGALRWVRPLHSIVCTFGPETETPDIVPFEVDGIASGDITYGHRFMAPAPIQVRRFQDYVVALERARVVLDADRRKDIILHDAKDLAFARGLELIEDEALLEEVAGLVEWPVVLTGTFEEAYLTLPPEVIRATIRANQKCFVLKKADGSLANAFLLVANLAAHDDGKAIVSGNERVVRARLADAKFFYETDLKTPLEVQADKLKAVIFHEKLGTQFERSLRLADLAAHLAGYVDAAPDLARQAGLLAKADLVTEMVGEFPELQGLMGCYYYPETTQGSDPDQVHAIAQAIGSHYKPVGLFDDVPRTPVSIAVALADKLDILIGFWSIGEKPTGSKDPFALRRAALGTIRIILENQLRLNALEDDQPGFFADIRNAFTARLSQWLASASYRSIFERAVATSGLDLDHIQKEELVEKTAEALTLDLMAFFHDRLKVLLRDQGIPHDVVDAVLSQSQTDDFVLIVNKVDALYHFLNTDDGRNLLAGYRRAINILKIEEKKDNITYDEAPDFSLIRDQGQPEEQSLTVALAHTIRDTRDHVAQENFEGAMQTLAGLRPSVDAFFESVTVNDANPLIRVNRLKLLNALRAATSQVADFSKISIT